MVQWPRQPPSTNTCHGQVFTLFIADKYMNAPIQTIFNKYFYALLFFQIGLIGSSVIGIGMDIQEAINLSIYKQFEETGIQFAYPTQKLLFEQVGNRPSAPSVK